MRTTKYITQSNVIVAAVGVATILLNNLAGTYANVAIGVGTILIALPVYSTLKKMTGKSS